MRLLPSVQLGSSRKAKREKAARARLLGKRFHVDATAVDDRARLHDLVLRDHPEKLPPRHLRFLDHKSPLFQKPRLKEQSKQIIII